MECYDIGVLFVCDNNWLVGMVMDCDFVVCVILVGKLLEMCIYEVVFGLIEWCFDDDLLDEI